MSTATATKTETVLKFMDTYCIVLFDDTVTSIELVLDLLMNVLHYDENTAFEYVMEIQEEGKAVVKNRLTKEQANQLKDKIIDYANNHEDDSNLEVLVAKEI